MIFNAVLFKKKTYKEIIEKYDLVCVTIKKEKAKADSYYSEGDPADNIILQEALQKAEAYLGALDFVRESFSENTNGHPEEASEEDLKRIYAEIERQYKEETHNLYVYTKYNPVNQATFIKEKSWKARAYGWVLGIPQNKTDYASNYFHEHRIFDAINNLHKSAYFYECDKLDQTAIGEVNKDFNLLMDFAKAVFDSK